MLPVATVNVDGVRAAVRRGMPGWLRRCAPDVLCLQQVRAPDDALRAALGPSGSGVVASTGAASCAERWSDHAPVVAGYAV